jgi:hypothetical protein
MTLSVRHYEAAQSAELVSSIPCTVTQPTSSWRAIYEIDLWKDPDTGLVDEVNGPLVAGEILQVTAQFEATSELTYASALVQGVTLTQLPGATEVLGIEVTENAGENFSKTLLHHAYRSVSRNWKVPAGMETFRYLKLVTYCSSTLATAGATVAIMQDYGHLDVARWTTT